MNKILFILILLCHTSVFAQYNKGYQIWRESDAYAHILKLMTENNGKITDSCESMFSIPDKEIYIIKTDYIAGIPDTMNGYTIHVVDIDSNRSKLYKLQKEKKIQVFYFSKWHANLETHEYWVMPVVVKKKGIKYLLKAFRFYYYFHAENSQFEHTKNDCKSWQ